MNSNFSIDNIYITPEARELLNTDEIDDALSCHISTILPDTDLVSTHTDRNGTKFWIITEADQSMTKILLLKDS